MKDFKQIDKCDVWPHLQAGKKVFAVILKSRIFREGLNDLSEWATKGINNLLEEENVVFYEKKEKEEK